LAARSVDWFDRPVALPPGRARLATTVADRIRRCREYDRSSRRHLPCRHNICRARRDDDFDLEADELFRDLGGTFSAPLRPTILDRNGAAFDPAELAQSLHKRGRPLDRDRSIGRAQDSDGR
jgi:hypothetical protein